MAEISQLCKFQRIPDGLSVGFHLRRTLLCLAHLSVIDNWWQVDDWRADNIISTFLTLLPPRTDYVPCYHSTIDSN